ncbi:lysylphosphatidylglycerol synthase transmembrane domain-containing protein [Xylanimonas protaetiae]|uniref:Flippase-like domain-containing protein n=1 Tax=Xylanimonas protaetiae TaxID=2509457 RepID=A0A4P6F1P1_9MICO|nr:lysylphosphatidylglycerol synthase transmembrane domain-containing protein [Xylanimonas protaetiae]QAY69412.1 flippase-like domain-containing protein [Xylanimonas protaetiae]
MPETVPPAAAATPSGPQTAALRAVLFDEAAAPDADLVRVVDTPERRVRHPSDVLGMIASALGIGLVLLLSVVAHRTTEGVTADVQQGFADLLGQILHIPINVIDGLVTIILPVAVVIELGVRRLGRQVVESIAAAALGLLLGVATLLLVRHLGTDDFIRGLSVTDVNNVTSLKIPAYVSAIAAMLTVAGPRTRRRTVRIGWNVLIVALLIVLITNQVTLPGALLTLLLGRLAGQAVQYLSGVRSERAYGPALVQAVRRAGFRPTALVRVRDLGAASGVDDLARFEDVVAVTRSSDPAAVALTRAGDNRVYAMLTDDGVRRDVVVLDGDRQVVGVVTRLWRALRMRGLEGRAAMSLKSVAERTALLSYAAAGAGVRTPRLLGIGMADDSVALVQEHARGAVSLRDLPDEELAGERGDAVLAEAWEQLKRAHAAGLTHHQLTADVLLVHRDDDDGPHVWITGWEQGEIASSTLARRLDLTQLLSLLALRVGARRAVASAVRSLPDADISAIGPLLQTIALPSDTRVEMRRAKGLIDELRTAIVERLPETSVQPTRLARFGARTVITLALTIIAVAIVVTTINFEEIRAAVAEANPWWVAASFAFSGITWFGAALTLVAFTPGRISLLRSTLAQMAGSFVALATPAGIGPAALNMRFLSRRGVSVPMAVATVALVQISQIVVTVVLLIVISLATGSGALVQVPSNAILIGIGVTGAVVVALLLVPGIRRWAWEKSRPTLEQVWPRLSQMLGQPARLAAGLGGNVIMTMGYVLAFHAALQGFGRSLPIVDVAVIYLVGNTLGALVPTPGGVGGVEFALVGGLTAAGIPSAIALSVTLLFRFVSYWARVPIGWVAMRYLESKDDL